MVRVSASAASISTISPTPRSDSLPTDTSLENPRPRALPRDSTVPSMVPLCETMLVEPADGTSISSTAFTVIGQRPERLIIPMLFGPSSRTPSSCARAASFCWRAMPPSPLSAKPSVKMVATGTPALPQSSMAASTSPTMMKACSICAFTSSSFL